MKPFILRATSLLVLFALLLLQACKDKDEDAAVQPEVKTEEIVVTSPSDAVLHGNIVSKGKYPVTDYGFIYGPSSELNLERGLKISLGKDAIAGTYSKEVKNLHYHISNKSNPILYARAYMTTEKVTVFGQVASVKLPSTTIQGISPNTGKAGENITITGSFYTSNPDDVQVTFGNRTAKVVEVSPDKIVVEVPSAINFDNYRGRQVTVMLKVREESFNVSSTFSVLPTVTDFSPKSGQAGTLVKISGDNFNYNSSYGAAKVFFGQKEVSAFTNSSYELQATVPTGLTTSKVPVSVVIDGITTVLPDEFILLPHTVTSFSPAAGLPGSTLTIYGSGFPVTYPYSNSISVTIGGVAAYISHVTYSQITVTVPQGAYVGNNEVAVTISEQSVKAPQQFDVIAPAVTSFSPTSGGIGKEITIYGVFQTGQSYTVSFGSSAVTSSIATANTIKAVVPFSAPAGATQISVLFGNTRVYTAEDFTVLEPQITSFTPGTGAAGTTVTLNIANFTPNYYTMVKFGTVGAQIVSYTSSTMLVRVPTGITGPVKISVLHSGRTITNTEDFVITD